MAALHEFDISGRILVESEAVHVGDFKLRAVLTKIYSVCPWWDLLRHAGCAHIPSTIGEVS